MNDCVPDWSMDDDFRSLHNLLPTANQRKTMRPDNELIELVWQNGNVIMHSQTNREATSAVIEHKEGHRHEIPSKNGGSLPNNVIEEDDTSPWIPYPLEDSLGKDFCSDLFYGTPIVESVSIDKLGKDNMTGDRFVKFGFNEDANIFTNPVCKQSNRLHVEENMMAPSTSQNIGSMIPQASSAETSGFVNFSHFSRTNKIDAGSTYRNSDEKHLKTVIQREVGESSSIVSKSSGNWGSNQSQKQPDLGNSMSSGISDVLNKNVGDTQKISRERGQTETHDTTTVTSSSGGSGSSEGRTGQKTNHQNHKRKGRDVEESESHSEGAEYQSLEVGRQPQRSASARRSRAAEVHNLSERRRRDRINEKMKALQELIPHCNKTDKASMLDEAIEYLKSLQLQVQIMWMGSGMSPMVFPNAQQYLSLMGRGMGQAPMPSMPGSFQMPRVPIANQSIQSVLATNQATSILSPIMNPVNSPDQIQNANIPDAYARYLGFHQMQPPSQAMDLFSPYQSQLPRPSQTSAMIGGSEPPFDGKTTSENIRNG